MQSPILQTLWQRKDEQLKQLFGMLINSLAQNNLRVLEIGAFVERIAMELWRAFANPTISKFKFNCFFHTSEQV